MHYPFFAPEARSMRGEFAEARTASAARLVRLDDDGLVLESRKRFAGFLLCLAGRPRTGENPAKI